VSALGPGSNTRQQLLRSWARVTAGMTVVFEVGVMFSIPTLISSDRFAGRAQLEFSRRSRVV